MNAPPRAPRQAGFSLFETAVVLTVLLVLLGVLFERLDYYQQRAEQVAVQQTVANLRSALKIRLMQARLAGHAQETGALAGQNPFDWLERKPPNYAGALDAAGAALVEKGYWYFDVNTGTIVFLLNNHNFLVQTDSASIKFKVKSLRLPPNTAKPTGAFSDGDVTLEQVYD